VIVDDDHVVSAKSNHAVVEVDVGVCETDSVLPPAEYPVPATSLVTEYAAVVASSVAEEVYNAILNVSAVVLPLLLLFQKRECR
jgi:hypothetical protein